MRDDHLDFLSPFEHRDYSSPVEPNGVYDADGNKLAAEFTLTVRENEPRRIQPAFGGVVQAFAYGSLIGVFEDGCDLSGRTLAARSSEAVPKAKP